MPFRFNRLIPALLAVTVLLAWGATFRGHFHDWGGDFSLYVAHARNIAQGQPYGAVQFFGDPEIRQQSPPTYPPLFPLLIAPVYRIFGLDYGPMKAVVQAMWLLSAYLFWLLARRRGLPGAWAAAAMAVFLLSQTVLRQKDSVLSESTYAACSAAVLLLLDAVYRRGPDESKPVLYGVWTGLLLTLAYYARVNALTLVAGFALFELWRARRIRPFAITAGAVFAAGFLLYRLTLYDGHGYGGQFRLTPDVWVANAVYYFKASASLWTALPPVLRYPLTLALLALGVLGIVWALRRSPSVAEPAFVLYLIPVLMFSNAPTVRYITPVFPLLLIFAAEALRRASLEFVQAEGVRRAVLASLALVLVAGAALNVRAEMREPVPDGPEIATFQELKGWLIANTGERDVVLAWNPRVVSLYTGRPSTLYPEKHDPAEFDRIARKVHAAWVVSFHRGESDKTWLDPNVEGRPERYVPVWKNADFEVYRVAPPDGR